MNNFDWIHKFFFPSISFALHRFYAFSPLVVCLLFLQARRTHVPVHHFYRIIISIITTI